MSQAHITVKQRVEKMIVDAQQQFGCRVSIDQSHRSAEQAQQFHICHMFLHNFFKHLSPKHMSADGKTIDWLHLSNPTIIWELILHPEKLFLYTKNHTPAQKQTVNGRVSWIVGHEPDKQTTIKVMARFLETAHVTSMAAPGKHLCGEPCGCGGHASKHITGLACDVSGMERLGQQIILKHGGYKTSDEAVDHFLINYQLWRPLAHLQGKARESWHVEALPLHHTHAKPDTHLHQKLSHHRFSNHHGC